MESVVVERLSEMANSRGLLSGGHVANRQRRSGNDAAAIIVDTAHAA